MQVAELFARLGFNIDTRGLRDFQNNLRNLNTHTNNTIQNIKSQFLKLGTAIGAVFSISAIKSFSEQMASVEDSMLSLSEKLSLSVEQYKELISLTKEVGRVSSLTTEEAISMADAFASAGLSFEQIQNVLKTTAIFRDATGKKISAEEYANLFGNIQNVFGLDENGIKQAGNELITALNSGSLNIADFVESVKYVSNVAKEFGNLTTAETFSLISAVSTAVKGSTAGTSLASIITKLATPNKALQEIGIKTTEGGQVRKFTDLLFDINKTLKELPKERQLQILQNAFGNDASVLATSTSLFGNPNRFIEILQKTQSPKNLEEVALRSRSPFTQTLENFRSSLEGLWKTIWGDSKTGQFGLQNLLIPVLNKLTDTIERLNIAIRNLIISFSQKDNSSGFVNFLSKLKTDTKALGLIAFSFFMIKKVSLLIATFLLNIMKGIASIMGLVGGGVSFLGIARLNVLLIRAGQLLKIFSSSIIGLIAILKTPLNFAPFIATNVGLIFASLKQSLIANLKFIGTYLTLPFLLVLNDLIHFLKGDMATAIGDIIGEGGFFSNLLKRLVGSILTQIEALNELAQNFGFENLWSLIKAILGILVESGKIIYDFFIKSVITAVLGFINGLLFITRILGNIILNTKNSINAFIMILDKLWEGITFIGNKLLDAIKFIIDKSVYYIDTIFNFLLEKIPNPIKNFVGITQNPISKTFSNSMINNITINTNTNSNPTTIANTIVKTIRGYNLMLTE